MAPSLENLESFTFEHDAFTSREGDHAVQDNVIRLNARNRRGFSPILRLI
jgi:hypothetical protein